MTKRKEIRNSTAEFLIFQIEGKEQGVEVYYKDKTVGVPRKLWVCCLIALQITSDFI